MNISRSSTQARRATLDVIVDIGSNAARQRIDGDDGGSTTPQRRQLCGDVIVEQRR